MHSTGPGEWWSVVPPLEGCWYGDGKIFFLSTDGGPVTSSGTGEGRSLNTTSSAITSSFSMSQRDPALLENPDNLTVMPDGNIMLCEDTRADDKRRREVAYFE